MNGGHIMFLNCPAYMDNDGVTRCGLPAEVEYRYTLDSTDCPLEGAKIRCPAGHWFNGPIASLTWEGTDSYRPVTAAMAAGARQAGRAGPRADRADLGGPVIDGPDEQRQRIHRPNNAPAYYQGRPASVWIAAMRPRRSRTASQRLMLAVTG